MPKQRIERFMADMKRLKEKGAEEAFLTWTDVSDPKRWVQ